MDTLSNLIWTQPYWLILLAGIPVLIYLWTRRLSAKQPRLSVPILFEDIDYKTFKTRLAAGLPYILSLFLLFGVLALARPQIQWTEEQVKGHGIDIFMVIDLSSSMLSRDFDPDRLSVSKRLAGDFVKRRKYDRIGIVAFAGEAYTQAPLTTDHEVVLSLLNGINYGSIMDGTAIGMGLATAVNRLKDSPAKSKVVILLTDGVNNAGYISPTTATELAKEFGIKVYTIGVGSQGFAMSPRGRDFQGNFVFGRMPVEIDEQLLDKMSKATGGEYNRAVTAEALENIYDRIDQLEKSEIEISFLTESKEYYHVFLGFAFFFLILYLFLKYIYLNIWPE